MGVCLKTVIWGSFACRAAPRTKEQKRSMEERKETAAKPRRKKKKFKKRWLVLAVVVLVAAGGFLLRKKLKTLDSSVTIKAVRNVGYTLEVPDA